MNALAPVKTGNIQLSFSKDRVAATVRLIDPNSKKAPKPEAIINALERAGVTIDDEIRARVDQTIEDTKNGKGPVEPMIVAEATRPIHGKNEQIVWDESLEAQLGDWQEEMPADAYPVQAITRVEAGQRFARIQPAVSPKPGRDLFGEEVPANGSGEPLQLDPTIQHAEDDPSVLVAGVSGQVIQDELNVRIEPVYLIDGDIGLETGHVRTAAPIWVEGRICDRFAAQSDHHITTTSAIESAHVMSRRSIYVRRGIIGRQNGLVDAAEDIVAKFATDAFLKAGRDMVIGKQAMNSHLCAGRHLRAPAAGLIGGSAYIRETMHVASVGSDADIPTRIVLGVRTEVVFRLTTVAKRIRAARATLQRIQDLIDLLEAGKSNLNVEQRRVLRGLVSQTEDAEQAITGDEKEYTTLLDNLFADGPTSLHVEKVINPKTTLCIRDRMTRFDREVRGPVSVERQKIKNATELVLLDPKGIVIRPLPSERIDAEQVIEGFETPDFERAKVES